MADMTDGERIAEERIAEAARTGQNWLDLGGLGLERLPNALSKLTKLERLSLGILFEFDPKSVTFRLRATERSSLSDISAISSLSDLRELSLEGTNCNDLSPIAGLQQLQILVCQGTQVSALAPIAGLQHLQRLDCSGTKVSDLSPIAALQKLKHLDCSFTRVSDLSPVAGLQQLQSLNCGGTQVNDLSPIAKLRQLHRLHCNGTQVSDLSPIAKLQALRHLDCSMTAVGDLSPIAKIINLTRVEAKNCSVASVPSAIKNLRILQLLDLRENQIRTLPRELGELTNLESFSMFLSPKAGPSGLWLEGNPLEAPLPVLIAPGQPQATINVLRWLRDEPIETEPKEPDPPTPVEDADDPPAIPEQGAGPRVILDPTGRLVFAKPADLDAKGNDRNRLEALHPALREAAADLAKALQDHPSNLPNERLLQKAEAYRALVDLPLDEVNFARLYGAGMQLLNAAGATRRGLEAGRADVPDLTPIQDECLANIENLHPPFVLASREGQEMLADQTTIKLTAESVADVKEAGLEFGKELINNPDLADRNVGEIIRDAAAEIGQGDNNTRDAVNAVATMRNAVIVVATASKWAIIPSIVGLAVGGPAGAVAAGGATLGWYLAKVAEKTKSFRTDTDNAANTWNSEADKMRIIRRRAEEHKKLFLKVEPKLRKITHLPGFNWLESSLDWLKRNTPPDNKE
jgi:Leucine-rich repeat (LRR) protein